MPGAVQQSPVGAAPISERCGLVWAWEDGSQGDCFKMERAEGLLGHLHSQIRAGHHSFPGGKRKLGPGLS